MSLSDNSPLLLHNPRCSKSRAAKAWLDEQGKSYKVRLYLEEPLNQAELTELGELLGLPAREWVRSGESAYAECGLTANSSAEDHARAISTNPVLMERPIVVHGKRAAIGRPLEKVIELFEDED